jgi:hypothetical protein
MVLLDLAKPGKSLVACVQLINWASVMNGGWLFVFP